MKEIINKLIEYQTLDAQEAKQVLVDIGQGKYNHAQIAAFISVYMMRTITVEELSGFRSALLDLCKKVDFQGVPVIDLCGTGGDGKNTFNISTLSSFVVAGAGVKVAKHGNYGVSSGCGSSNVMEYLGYSFTNDQDVLRRQLDQANICIMHAPLFHPAMKEVGPVRRELGMKTFFNMLGPLVNPAFPEFQSVGVFSLELARLYKYLLQPTSSTYNILHAIDGYDEASLTGDLKVITNNKDQILSPEDLGFSKLREEDLHGGETVEQAGKIFTEILSGRFTDAQKSVVIANSAFAISTYSNISFEEAKQKAEESLLSGAAFDKLNKLLSLN